jgi:hypothetical protein
MDEQRAVRDAWNELSNWLEILCERINVKSGKKVLDFVAEQSDHIVIRNYENDKQLEVELRNNPCRVWCKHELREEEYPCHFGPDKADSRVWKVRFESPSSKALFTPELMSKRLFYFVLPI